MTDNSGGQIPLELLLQHLRSLSEPGDDLPDPNTEIGKATHEFFANNWENARDGLLSRTDRVRFWPSPGPGPRSFTFEIDLPYKRKGMNGGVEVAPGPVRGTVLYRSDVLTPEPGGHSIVVFIDTDLGFYHPNYSRKHGVLCIGDIPNGPFPLDALIEHIYGIVSYQNRDSDNPADMEAVRYFTADPGAFEGLDDVPRLY